MPAEVAVAGVAGVVGGGGGGGVSAAAVASTTPQLPPPMPFVLRHPLRSMTPPATITYARGFVGGSNNNNDDDGDDTTSTSTTPIIPPHRAMTPPPRWNLAAMAEAPNTSTATKIIVNEFRSQFTKNADVAFDEFCKKYLNSKNGFFSFESNLSQATQATTGGTCHTQAAQSTARSLKVFQQNNHHNHNHHHHHHHHTCKPIIQHGSSINKISLNSTLAYSSPKPQHNPNKSLNE